MDAKKKLDPGFLMEAMDLAEEVSHAQGDTAALQHRITQKLTANLDGLRQTLARRAFAEAATLLHQSRYAKKALQDLEDKS